MKVTVVTPWLDHRELEQDYWAAMRVADVEVLVIDNGSTPPLPNAWRSESNLGFSAACNLGLRMARTEAVLFLNNDVAATEANWIEGIREALEPGVLVGANLQYAEHANVDGQQMPYLDGWCLAGMREDLLELEGFDETFAEPSYYGDNDLCFRARLAGMSLREAHVGLRHKTNATAGDWTNPKVMAATLANRERYVTLVREALTGHSSPHPAVLHRSSPNPVEATYLSGSPA